MSLPRAETTPWGYVPAPPAINGSILRILPVLRHSILVEAPEIVAGALGDFLAGRLAGS